MCNTELKFFASANSGRGFINFYSGVFDNLKKHYIIKGGPGTGKSSLMKAVARKAEEKGMTVERFYCSSDPDSLDGIIINELSLGITDGTAPHTADPKYPGVIDKIVDLGLFWDENKLKDAKELITDSVNKKSKLYKTVYSYLEAALILDNIKQSVDLKGLYTLTRSYADVLPFRYGKESVRLTEGITMKGRYRFTPYRNGAMIIYNIKDSYGIGHLFLHHLKALLSGCEMTVSYNALDTDKVNMIYLPTDKILFCINSEEGVEINIDDYTLNDNTVARNAKARKEELLSDAFSLLSEIEKLHFSLEKNYISAMNFSRKEEYQDKLIKEIFS